MPPVFPGATLPRRSYNVIQFHPTTVTDQAVNLPAWIDDLARRSLGEMGGDFDLSSLTFECFPPGSDERWTEGYYTVVVSCEAAA